MPQHEKQVLDWIYSALELTGLELTAHNVGALYRLIVHESGGKSPELRGEFGYGDPYDPVVQIAASINYQLARYGEIIDFYAPLEEGGTCNQ